MVSVLPEWQFFSFSFRKIKKITLIYILVLFLSIELKIGVKSG